MYGILINQLLAQLLPYKTLKYKKFNNAYYLEMINITEANQACTEQK